MRYYDFFRNNSMAKRTSVASDIFNSPPRGSNLSKVNADYDSILENLNSLAATAEAAFSSIMAGIGEVREAVNERRSLVIRGEVADETYGPNISPEEGNFRWIWFTDGSSGKLPEGDTIRFGIGAFFGWEHPLNFGLPANLNCSSMYECEIEAVYTAFLAAKRMADAKNGIPTCRRITICVDNSEAVEIIQTAILETEGMTCLESLLANNSRVRNMIHEIREMIKIYDSVEMKWVRAHTGSRSFLARGNDQADKLAKEGLSKSFELIEELQ